MRLAGAQALRAVLTLIADRPQGRVEALHSLFEEVLSGLVKKKPSSLHGSLLAIGARCLRFWPSAFCWPCKIAHARTHTLAQASC